MGKIVFAGIAPHPPIIVEEVGGGSNLEALETIRAMKDWVKKLKDSAPDVLVFFTPHGNLFRDAIAIHGFTEMKGDFSDFGVRGSSYVFTNNLELKSLIVEEAENRGFKMVSVDEKNAKAYGLKTELDHGVLVPLDFIIKEGLKIPIVVMSTALLDYDELYDFGKAVKEAIGRTFINAAVIASGDLSHRLTKGAPAGYDELGKKFDNRIVEIVKEGSLRELLNLDETLVDRAGECGLRPMIMLAGVLDEYKLKTDFKSYEGPFGVGYLVASFDLIKKSNVDADRKEKDESMYVQLAKESIRYYMKNNKYLPVPEILPSELKVKKGCFVSLKRDGHLRGCIGTIMPAYENLAEEIIKNSVSAGFMDDRFMPLREDEFARIDISVDVLSEPEEVTSKNDLDAQEYGVIVRSISGKTGVLLPNLPGVDNIDEQLQITLNKADINKGEEYQIFRFKVDRYY